MPSTPRTGETSGSDEIWGYSYDQIQAYLMSQGAAADGDTYDLGDCIVILESLPDRQVGKLFFAQTRVQIKGSGAEKFRHRFELHFLSGGA